MLNYLTKILPLYFNIKTKKTNIFSIYIKKKYIFFILFFFKNHYFCKYKILSFISATDYLNRITRFELIYELITPYPNKNTISRIILKTLLSENKEIQSISSIFQNADWLEREIWDLFGIFFKKNKNLRRLLTDYGFNFFPLRKDFPISGFSEIYYSINFKQLTYRPIFLEKEEDKSYYQYSLWK